MFELYVTNEKNQTLNLNDQVNYAVVDADGMGSLSAGVSIEPLVASDTSKINSAYVKYRPINLSILPRRNIEMMRRQLYQFFSVKHSVNLHYRSYQRDLRISGVVESCEPTLFEKPQTMHVSIICEDPYWKDAYTFINDISYLIKLFEFPFSIEEPVEFEQINTEMVQTVVNTGDFETGVVIKIKALNTVVNPEVYSIDERKTIRLLFTMRAGDMITIDTRTGKKSITLLRDGTAQNIINTMQRELNSLKNYWFVLSAGENRFAYFADEGNEFMEITIEHSNLYQGV